MFGQDEGRPEPRLSTAPQPGTGEDIGHDGRTGNHPATVMAITESPQSRSSKFPTLGVLVSLAGTSFRSVFSGLCLVGA